MHSGVYELRLPDLGLGSDAVTASVWLVGEGAQVSRNDRLLEVASGSVTVDIPSPVDGVLIEQVVAEDDALAVGQLVARIRPSETA